MSDANPSQTATPLGSQNIIVQVQGDGNTTTIGVPFLTLIPPRNRKREIRTEIDLLNAYCRSIPLIGREADMASLWDWLHSDKPVSVRTLTGRAGAGKTRIAIELIERALEEKWWAGFVRGSEMKRFSAQQNPADWGWARPTLVVVDYAASHTGPLREWLRGLAENPGCHTHPPLRLLFLEREASANEGWLQFLCSGGYSDAGVPDLFDPLEPKRLDVLDTLEKRRSVLSEMLTHVADLVKGPPSQLPALGQNPRVDRQLENAEWEDPLYLMMAALLSRSSDLVEVLQLPRTGLALKLVDHEIKRLVEGLPPEAERLTVHLAMFAALGGGLSQETARNLAAEEGTALGLNYPGGAGALAAHLHEVLPARDHGISSIIPDILAEALVLKGMEACSTEQQQSVVLRAVKMLGRQVIPFIIRTVQDFAHEGRSEPLQWLEALIQAGKTDDLGLLMEIDSSMPHQTLALREKAVEIGELLVERLAVIGSSDSSEEILAEQSRLMNNLSNRLSELGRREEALKNAQESVRIYGQLAESRPDTFPPYLAASLTTLAVRLSELGRREEALKNAQESVRVLGQLAKSRPDAFLPDLAISLNNLATMLSDLGGREEALEKAQESVRIYRQLAESRPDAFLPYLAMSLNNLATMLRDLGGREEALEKVQESVRIREQMAEFLPDAFLPDLAMSLNNLANTLSALGRREEALQKAGEAVRIHEQLANSGPDAFLPDLARSYGARGAILQTMEKHLEAAASFGHGIQTLTPFYFKMPQAFSVLIGSLCRDYIQACESAKQVPDMTLLKPVSEVFKKLNQTQTEK